MGAHSIGPGDVVYGAKQQESPLATVRIRVKLGVPWSGEMGFEEAT